MKTNSLPSLFLKTRPYRVWSFLTLHSNEAVYGAQISDATGVSRGATSQILNEFLKNGLVSRKRIGKMWLYTLEQNPLAQHFRVLENLIMLSGLVRRIAEISARVILYGSAAQGTDTSESDIDLFVITEEPDKVAAEIRCFPSDRLIMPVIQTSAEYAVSRIKDGAFIDEVKRGVVLFEKAIDEQRL